MRFKKWCVTVMDNWTPARTFWTHRGASRFFLQHGNAAHLFLWKEGRWIEWGRIGQRIKNWLCQGGHGWTGEIDTCCPECGRRPSTEAPN
jgi:hypothetical protein